MNTNSKISLNELLKVVESKSGKAGGWPNYFKYYIDSDFAAVSVDVKDLDKKACRRLDPWGLAFLNEAKSRCGIELKGLKFILSGSSDVIEIQGRLAPNLEAFRRRFSFLQINNPGLVFGIAVNGQALMLDNAETLFNRPGNEEVRKKYKGIAADNEPGRLEKDFQTWLHDVKGHGFRLNERLAVLGEDFFKMKKKAMGIVREFPTGVFQERISDSSRILPTDFVDIVTFNKYGNLAIIELKLNDSQLEVIAQMVDYALFFRTYRTKLWPVLIEKLQKTPKTSDIVCYVVNNHYHDRFDEVAQYYGTRNRTYGFKIVKVVLGSSQEIEGTTQDKGRCAPFED